MLGSSRQPDRESRSPKMDRSDDDRQDKDARTSLIPLMDRLADVQSGERKREHRDGDENYALTNSPGHERGADRQHRRDDGQRP